MPTVLRIDGYRLFFYANEGSEPPHVHVESAANEVKFWLRPVALAANDGYSQHELNRVRRIIDEHQDQLEEAWRGFHGT